MVKKLQSILQFGWTYSGYIPFSIVESKLLHCDKFWRIKIQAWGIIFLWTVHFTLKTTQYNISMKSIVQNHTNFQTPPISIFPGIPLIKHARYTHHWAIPRGLSLRKRRTRFWDFENPFLGFWKIFRDFQSQKSLENKCQRFHKTLLLYFCLAFVCIAQTTIEL